MGIHVFIDNGAPGADEATDGRVPPNETCIFWRALRKVLNDGNPAREHVVVQVAGRRGATYPLLERHQWIRFPSPDAQRRKEEYVRFFTSMRFVDAGLPAERAPGRDVLFGFLYVVDRPEVSLSTALIPPFSESPTEFWDAPVSPESFNARSTGFAVGTMQIRLLLGLLPGRLRENVPFLGSPGM